MTIDFQLLTLDSRLSTSQDEVHIWLASLDPKPEALRHFGTLLAPDESARAARFVFQRDRDRFIAGRGILRELLAAYLEKPADELKFDYGVCGKPRIRLEERHAALRFNLSHSDGLALYAVTEGREVGIDVELIRPDFGGMEVAERFFSARELSDLRALPPHLRANGFFVCWTEKEAYVKAQGDGLQIPLDSFDVPVTASGPEELRAPDGAIWTLHSFQPARHFVAAVVAEGTGWQPHFFKYSGYKGSG